MHQDSGIRLRVVKATLLERAFEPNEEASFELIVRNEGTRLAEEVIGVVTSGHDKLKVYTEMLRLGNIAAGGEGKARLELQSEDIAPGLYTVKVVLSAVGAAAVHDAFRVEIVPD